MYASTVSDNAAAAPPVNFKGDPQKGLDEVNFVAKNKDEAEAEYSLGLQLQAAAGKGGAVPAPSAVSASSQADSQETTAANESDNESSAAIEVDDGPSTATETDDEASDATVTDVGSSNATETDSASSAGATVTDAESSVSSSESAAPPMSEPSPSPNVPVQGQNVAQSPASPVVSIPPAPSTGQAQESGTCSAGLNCSEDGKSFSLCGPKGWIPVGAPASFADPRVYDSPADFHIFRRCRCGYNLQGWSNCVCERPAQSSRSFHLRAIYHRVCQ